MVDMKMKFSHLFHAKEKFINFLLQASVHIRTKLNNQMKYNEVLSWESISCIYAVHDNLNVAMEIHNLAVHVVVINIFVSLIQMKNKYIKTLTFEKFSRILTN